MGPAQAKGFVSVAHYVQAQIRARSSANTAGEDVAASKGEPPAVAPAQPSVDGVQAIQKPAKATQATGDILPSVTSDEPLLVAEVDVSAAKLPPAGKQKGTTGGQIAQSKTHVLKSV